MSLSYIKEIKTSEVFWIENGVLKCVKCATLLAKCSHNSEQTFGSPL